MAEFQGLPDGAEVVQYVGLPEGAEVVQPAPSAPKPSLLRRGAGLVGGAIAEIPQLAYEGLVAAPVNAMSRGLQHATTTVPAFLGGVAGGQSAGDAAAMADVERKRIAQSNLLPPTFGQGSWVGQGIGHVVNSLIDKGIISPESAQGVGDILAVVGGGKVANKLRPIQTIKSIPDRYRAAFPSAEVRAGEMLHNARKAVPSEVDSIAARAGNQEAAKALVGEQRFPEQAAPNIRRQQVAADRASNSADVRATDTALAENMRAKADTALDTVIPRETIDPARLEFLNKKIEAHNAGLESAAQATTSGAKEAARAGVESAAKAALDEVEAVVPKTGRLDPLPMGQRILSRLRGEGGDTGIQAVKKVFNEEYGKFDQAGASASSTDLMNAVRDSASVSTETGRVLRGFVDDAKKIEGRLGSEGMGPDGMDVFNFPENLTLKQFRGMKGEFAAAADLAHKAGNRPAALELGRLAEIARKGEDAAVKGLGPEMVTKYDAVRAAYKNTLVDPYYRGYGSKMTGAGSQSGGGRVPPAQVMNQLMNRQNAHDFILALGAEEAAKTGKLVTGLSETDLLKMGQSAARETVQPHVESTVSTLYKNAGGGKKGVAAVEKYLNTNANTLDAYGIDLGGLRGAATKYNDTMARLTGAKTVAAKSVVEGVVKVTDATKLGKYVVDQASPSSAYKNLLGVSKDPVWKASIDTLMIDELRSRIKAGEDVFGNVKTRALAEAIWSPEQLQKLKAYQAVATELGTKPARFGGQNMPEHSLGEVLGAGQALPVGIGPGYVVKYGAKFLAKLKLTKDNKAVLEVLDAALMDPERADMVYKAYKGSPFAAKQLKKEIAATERSWKLLAGTKALKTVSPAAKGAVSTAGQKKLHSEMTDEELLSQ
jgi:hypothetical protein